VIWCQAAAGSGGSQGFPASAALTASGALTLPAAEKKLSLHSLTKNFIRR
jgi:hypothetical protein